MKVYKGQGSIIQQADKTSKNKEIEGYDFQKIMDEMVPKSENKDGLPAKDKIPPVDNGIQILYTAEKSNVSGGSSDKKQLVNDLQNTLDLLDFYAERLADSSITVSDLNPLVSHLESEIENLKDLESSSSIPLKVKPVISDMIITIGSEIAKYRRGDYM